MVTQYIIILNKFLAYNSPSWDKRWINQAQNQK